MHVLPGHLYHDEVAEDCLVNLHTELLGHFVVYYDQARTRKTSDFRFFPVRKAGCIPPPPQHIIRARSVAFVPAWFAARVIL